MTCSAGLPTSRRNSSRKKRMNLSARCSYAKHMKQVVAGQHLQRTADSAACIPNLRNPVPAPKVPENFKGSTGPENSALVGIDRVCALDPLLQCLIHQALSPVGNRELQDPE